SLRTRQSQLKLACPIPRHEGPMDLLLMILSPLIVTPLCIRFYILEVRRTKWGFKYTSEGFLRDVILWGMIGFIVAFLVVIFLTALYNSPQGPLALIFYGPLGIAIGEIVGAMKWRIRLAKVDLALNREK